MSPLLPHFQATLPIIPNAHLLGSLGQAQPVAQFRFVAIFVRILVAANNARRGASGRARSCGSGRARSMPQHIAVGTVRQFLRNYQYTQNG
jgi:hypothetical protein